MDSKPLAESGVEGASVVVVDPSGHRRRIPVHPLPFRIGRQADNHVIVRDSRASRNHARIVLENGRYFIEDCDSRHGTFVNGVRVKRQELKNSDRLEFGALDSYQLVFALDGVELKRLMQQMSEPESVSSSGVGGNLGKLKAILDLARTLQGAFSIDDVLASVVDTALAITGAERGFLLLKTPDGLETRVARHRQGGNLNESDLRVPRALIHRALQHRRELLSMNFDPLESDAQSPGSSVADLDLRSVTCVPLVRIRTSQGDATSILAAGSETVGVLYMDSRVSAADLAGGNRELLQTLAIEASTVLENARLLEEERAKQQMQEELRLAQNIQQSLLPRSLPVTGWFRACGSSLASLQVGGDYYDAAEIDGTRWSAVVADVSGKGVASALLASLLQGALITAAHNPDALQRRMERLNRFLLARTEGEKYATIFYCLLESTGLMHYVNAAQCPPILVRASKPPVLLEATAMPVGLLDSAEFPTAEQWLSAGDKLVIYTDGVTEAQNTSGGFFGRQRLLNLLASHAGEGCQAIHDAIQEAVAAFTEGAAQSDDITVLVLEFFGN
jgi:serine phosphatase RsbU (regulator of sigma subunit)